MNLHELKINKEIEFKNRKFTQLVGGFNKNNPIITIKQIAELLNKQSIHITERINKNIQYFENGIHLIDLKVIDQTDNNLEVLKLLGYTNMAISKAKNLYILSEAGFLLYLKFAEGDKAVELYKDFIEEYFKVKAENKVMEKTLQETLKTLDEESSYILGAMFKEKDKTKKLELFNRSQELERQMKDIEITLAKEETAKQFEDIVKIAEQFTNSKGLYDIGEFSKMLDIKGFGRNNMFSWMRERKMLMSNNIPYQNHSDHFKVITTFAPNGFKTSKTLLKPQGISYIVKKLIEDGKLEKSDYNTLIIKASELSKIEG